MPVGNAGSRLQVPQSSLMPPNKENIKDSKAIKPPQVSHLKTHSFVQKSNDQQNDAPGLKGSFADRQRVRMLKAKGASVEDQLREHRVQNPKSESRPKGWKRLGRFFTRTIARMFGKSSEKLPTVIKGPYANVLKNQLNDPPAVKSYGNQFQDRADKSLTFSDKELASSLKNDAKLFKKGTKSLDGRFWKPGYNYRSNSHTYSRKNPNENQPLFTQAPRIEDIRQSDHRATCPFLASLNSLLAKPDGAERLQSIMRDNQDGTVTVRFNDRDITVSRHSIVNRRGQNVLSDGAEWVSIMEKAYLGYCISKREEALAGVGLNPDDQLNFVNDENEFGIGYRFDQNSMMNGAAALSHALHPDISKCAEVSDQTVNGFEMMGKDGMTRPDEVHDKIEKSLAENKIVTLNSRGFFTSNLSHRITPGHIYTAVGTGERNGKKGLWIVDSYGSSVGKSPDVQTTPDGQVKISNAVRGKSPMFFMPTEEVCENFSDVGITGYENKVAKEQAYQAKINLRSLNDLHDEVSKANIDENERQQVLSKIDDLKQKLEVVEKQILPTSAETEAEINQASQELNQILNEMYRNKQLAAPPNPLLAINN